MLTPHKINGRRERNRKFNWNASAIKIFPTKEEKKEKNKEKSTKQKSTLTKFFTDLEILK